MKNKIIKLIKQAFKFGIVGVIAFLIDYLLFALLIKVGIHYLIAQIISFAISLTFNCIASIKWVFNVEEKTIKSIIIFIVVSLIGLGLDEIILYIGVNDLGHNELIIKLVSTVIVMIYNFFVKKFLLENKPSNKKIYITLSIIIFMISILFLIYKII